VLDKGIKGERYEYKYSMFKLFRLLLLSMLSRRLSKRAWSSTLRRVKDFNLWGKP
jgi:hypothetical protein